MKMSPEESSEYNDTVMAKQPLYPWGLNIMLDDDAMEKLDMKLPALDEVVEFRCKAQVTSVNSRKDGNDDEDSMVGLQITDMEIVSSGKDAASKLYKEMK